MVISWRKRRDIYVEEGIYMLMAREKKKRQKNMMKFLTFSVLYFYLAYPLLS